MPSKVESCPNCGNKELSYRVGSLEPFCIKCGWGTGKITQKVLIKQKVVQSKVDVVRFQKVFGKIPRRRVELMKCPTKEDSRGRNKRCPELARRARGECTEANCVQLGEKFEKLYRRQKRTERAFSIATGQKSEKDDPLLHPKGIPWRDQKILRKIKPEYNYRTKERKKLQEQLVKSGMNKMSRLSRKRVKHRYNKEVVVLETMFGLAAEKTILKAVWQKRLEECDRLKFRVMKAHVFTYGGLPESGHIRNRQVVVLESMDGEGLDSKQLASSWRRTIKIIAPHYRLKIAKVYKGKGKLK